MVLGLLGLAEHLAYPSDMYSLFTETPSLYSDCLSLSTESLSLLPGTNVQGRKIYQRSHYRRCHVSRGQAKPTIPPRQLTCNGKWSGRVSSVNGSRGYIKRRWSQGGTLKHSRTPQTQKPHSRFHLGTYSIKREASNRFEENTCNYGTSPNRRCWSWSYG